MGQQTVTDQAGDNVTGVDIAERMERSFLDYSMSVIIDRALPDVRDGLKPVQRRILYAMWEAGLRPDRPYRKCASAVGDVMKKYHPHGDSSIYQAMVRMAQPFSTRALLVDGHGNFGSVDGDGAAAMRYTEARLSAAAMELLAGIDEDTVDYAPNYDGYENEPTVLPARFPNLLVNGATGIAVGMATNIPPHNLGEVVDACRLLIRRPGATVDEIMEKVPAPDFPTGARIIETDGIRDAYLTGTGAVTVESVATTETRSGGLPRIVITEMPYQVNKAALLEKVADMVKAGKLDAVRDLRDESSRDGMRVVVELKRGEDPVRVLDRLYKTTDLRTNFNVNFVALRDGRPQTMSIRDALTAYLAHQRDVLTRRTESRLRKAEARAHVVEGLLTALGRIDEVIATIKKSQTPDTARTNLRKRFGLSDVQATAILDMQLRRLARLEADKLRAELGELKGTIKALKKILADPAELDALLDAELSAVRKEYADPRRSRLTDRSALSAVGNGGTNAGGGDQPVVLDAQEVILTVSRDGYLRSVASRRQPPAHGADHDPLVASLRTAADKTVLLVDRRGTGHRLGAAAVPMGSTRSRGVTLAQLEGEGPAAPLAGAVVLSGARYVVTASAQGLVKVSEAAEYDVRTSSVVAAGVKPGDEIVAVATADDGDDLVVAHSGGYVTRFRGSEVRPMGRTAAGVSALKVPKGERVVSLTTVPKGTDDGEVVTVSADGGAKRSPLSEYPVKGRSGKGLQTGKGRIVFCGTARGSLHARTAEGWEVVRPELLTAAKRAGKPEHAVDGPVEGVVPETGPPA